MRSFSISYLIRNFLFLRKFGITKIPDLRLHHQIDEESIYKEAPRDRLHDALATSGRSGKGANS